MTIFYFHIVSTAWNGEKIPFFVKRQHLCQSNKEYLISPRHLSEPTSCIPFSESFFNADSSLPQRSHSSSFHQRTIISSGSCLTSCAVISHSTETVYVVFSSLDSELLTSFLFLCFMSWRLKIKFLVNVCEGGDRYYT